ncbi:MAG: SDR family NAD(P)-dependent oxidoreductase [Microbacterium sp.]|uniref:SDR family NAD(P)-dependent oxidoreductase n=1 Tax=Microbacterium sp. TaxID=51671 RepID=UPI003A8512DC
MGSCAHGHDCVRYRRSRDAMRTIVMTGASRGIGRAALHRFAAQPHTHVVLLGRSTRERSALRGRRVHADLSSMRSVDAAAEEVAELVGSGRLPPIEALVLNAGVQHTNALTETVDGLESTFAVNVLANHILLTRLRSHLSSTARIVVTVSDTHFGDFRHNLAMVPGPKWQPVERLARVGAFPDPASVSAGRTAYSTSKLAAIYLVHEHVRRFPSGPSILSYNPGFVPGTSLARDADAVSRFAMRWIMPLLTLTPLATTPARAGRLLTDTALGAVAAPNGAYIDRDRAAQSSPESYDAVREQHTWEVVEAIVAEVLQRPTT